MSARRIFVAALALGVLLAPLAVEGQPQRGRVPRIGFLGPTSPEALQHVVRAFREGLREHGWVEDQNIAIEYRWAEGQIDRFPMLAAELVRMKVDVIVVPSTPAALAAKRATATIPIVMTSGGDPVGSGLVASLARPGGNVTGLSNLAEDLVAKLLELLKAAVPDASRIAILVNPHNRVHSTFTKEADAAARVLNVQLVPLEARAPGEFESAFAAMARERAAATIVLPDPMFVTHRERIVRLSAQGRLPAVYAFREFVDSGGLMSYGANIADNARRSAAYVDKILKGAKPADLPVEQPSKFELVINLKTAKALGLTIPQSVLIRADEVIQ